MRRALSLAAFLAVLAPTAADAAVTRSAVTSPASPAYLFWDESKSTPSLTIEAATDGAEGDLVDLVCTSGADSSVAFDDVEVEPGGRVSVRIGYDEIGVRPCTYRIVPAGYVGPGFSAFAGTVVAPTQYYVPEIAIHATTRTASNTYSVRTANLRGIAGLGSAGDDGLAALHGVRSRTLEPFEHATWTGGAALAGDRDRPGIAVDGAIAYAAAEVPLLDFDGPEGAEAIRAPSGFTGVQSAVRHDPAGGTVTVTESQAIQRCARLSGSEEPSVDNCSTVINTGVRLERTIALTAGHAVADVRDRWVSTDGLPHVVGARYTALSPEKIEAPLWRFPGEALFTARGPGEVLAPRRPGTALTRENEVKAGPGRAAGALSFAPAAALVTFGAGTFETLALAVPAGGQVPVRRVFAVGDDVAEAQAHGSRAEDSFVAPRLTLSAAASTTARTALVRGRATDNVRVVALAVGGRRVAPATDGSFTVTVPLAGGPNTVVATATDGAGLTAAARTVVRRICRVPKVRRGVRVTAARTALEKSGCVARKRTTRIRSRAVRKGRVVGLTRRPGTVLRGGTAVGIRVSGGRKVRGIRN